MRPFHLAAWCFGLCLLLNQASTSRAQTMTPTVTLRSLLAEMVTPDSIARWPDPGFKVKQASSYDRARVAPNKPGWFANNDGSNYLRTEEHDGHQEKVMMDADGPGAIVRFHLTNSGSLAARVRIYLDGSAAPTVEFPTSDLMDNDLKVGAPLISRQPPPLGHGAATMYLPIPYAKHCKITIEERESGGRYYHVDYRSYAPGTAVETFSRNALDAGRPDIMRVNLLLITPPNPQVRGNAAIEKVLEPGSEISLQLPPGPHAVRQLELSIGADLSPAVREQILRSIVIKATFDKETDAIWCPVGDFEGSGAGGRALQSWYREVNDNGEAVCRWTMPYEQSGHFALQNLGTQRVVVKMTARFGDWEWNDRSLYFHANWHQQTKIRSVPPRDWNFLTVAGRGVLVGDVMSVFNPLPSWYGEGNEKIWVDDEPFPSHIGTGTEDYYNASWAPNPVYHTPFTNHPRMDDALSQGQNVYTRTRNLDVVPFEKRLRFDFEIITWRESQVDYATTTYWYGAPGARATLTSQPDEARRPVPVITPPLVLENSLECEALPIVDRTPGLGVETQDMRYASGSWSGNAHLLIRGKKVGDFVELEIPTEGDSPCSLTLYATRANDYGILKFMVNGQAVDQTFDGYAPNPTPLAAIPLGVFTPLNGHLRVRAELVGTNPQSVGDHYLAALDAVVVAR